MPLHTFQTTFSGVKVIKDVPTKDSRKPPSVGQLLPKGHEFTSDLDRLQQFSLKKYIPYDHTTLDGTRYEGWLQKRKCEEVEQTGGASTIIGGGDCPPPPRRWSRRRSRHPARPPVRLSMVRPRVPTRRRRVRST